MIAVAAEGGSLIAGVANAAPSASFVVDDDNDDTAMTIQFALGGPGGAGDLDLQGIRFLLQPVLGGPQEGGVILEGTG